MNEPAPKRPQCIRSCLDSDSDFVLTVTMSSWPPSDDDRLHMVPREDQKRLNASESEKNRKRLFRLEEGANR